MALDIQINHILADGSLENHSKTEHRLLALLKLSQPDLFKREGQRIEEAYDLQGRKIAYDVDEFPNDDTLTGVDNRDDI